MVMVTVRAAVSVTARINILPKIVGRRRTAFTSLVPSFQSSDLDDGLQQVWRRG